MSAVRDVLLVLLASSALAAPARGQQQRYAQANQRYQDGDYAGAIQAYQDVLQGGYDGADLHYNLGNAWFKSGDLGHAILEWERALALRPHDEDAAANLELARGLVTDDIQPLPRFWLLSVWSWWVNLLPAGVLAALVGLGWLALTGGVATRILGGWSGARWVALVGALVVLVLGTNLAVRELGLGRPERGVILAEMVPVRSAPSDDDNLTLFEVHEGTTVRVDREADGWAEVVLADGKVGWVPTSSFGMI